ncbi:hypothetical protein ABK040_010156 [Willaertia magna]
MHFDLYLSTNQQHDNSSSTPPTPPISESEQQQQYGDHHQKQERKTINSNLKHFSSEDLPKKLKHAKIKKIISGSRFSLILTNEGNVFTFGITDFIDNSTNNSYRDVKDDDFKSFKKLKLTRDLKKKKIKDISCGMRFILLQLEDYNNVNNNSDDYNNGIIYSGGDNECGQRGIGQESSLRQFLPIKFNLNNNNTNNTNLNNNLNNNLSKDIIKMSCGYQHCILLSKNGIMYGTGCSYQSQLGSIENGISYYFTELKNNPKDVIDVQCAYFSSFCLTKEGKVYVTGDLGYSYVMDAKDWTLIDLFKDLIIDSIYISCSNLFFLTKGGENVFVGGPKNNFILSEDLKRFTSNNNTSSDDDEIVDNSSEMMNRVLDLYGGRGICNVYGKEQFHFVTNYGEVYACGTNRKLLGLDESVISNSDKNGSSLFIWKKVEGLNTSGNRKVTIANGFDFCLFVVQDELSNRIIEKLKEICNYQFDNMVFEKNVFYDCKINW